MLTPRTSKWCLRWTSDAYTGLPSDSGYEWLSERWCRDMRRKSLSQRCDGYRSWRWEAGIVYHACMGFVKSVRRTTWRIWRLRLEKRLHGCLEWRMSYREWGRRMIALLQRRRQPRREHGLSAIKWLLHTKRRGNTETGRRLSYLRGHICPWTKLSWSWLLFRSSRMVPEGEIARRALHGAVTREPSLSLPGGYLTSKTSVSGDKPKEKSPCPRKNSIRAKRQGSSRNKMQKTTQ